MKEFNVKTLKHLENSIPKEISGYSLSFYSIALEAWRRGLQVTFINSINKRKQTIRYRIKSKDNCYTFSGIRNRELAEPGRLIAMDKYKTKKYLIESNVPTPMGKKFDENASKDNIINYALDIGFPIVVKPLTGQGGEGVIAAIKDENELANALIYIREKLNYSKVVVEKHFDGEDYRVLVVGEEVVAITKRMPANIVGDGINTVKQLIKIKNSIRKKHPMLSSSRIKIDDELNEMLKKQGFDLDTVIESEKIVNLKSKNNISSGGDPIDITDDVSTNIKEIAINALKAMPGLKVAGVDLMVNEKENTAVVIEINTQASIRSHLFPIQGEPRDVPKKIIDVYFPETKHIKRNEFVYFPFKPIKENFDKGILQEFTLPEAPIKDISYDKFLLFGKEIDDSFKRKVRRFSRENQIYGQAEILETNTLEFLITGPKDRLIELKESFVRERFKIKKSQDSNQTENISVSSEFKFLDKKKRSKQNTEIIINESLKSRNKRDGLFGRFVNFFK